MNQIKSIRLGVVAICIATVPLSLAQTPRPRTSGSNQTSITTAAPIHTGSNGNSTGASQIGINAGRSVNIGTNMNAGAHTATTAGVQAGIGSQVNGLIRGVTGNGRSSNKLSGATQTGTNAAAGTNTTAKAETGTAANTRTFIDTLEPGATPALILFAATPTPAPIPSSSVSPTPSPTPTPTP